MALPAPALLPGGTLPAQVTMKKLPAEKVRSRRIELKNPFLSVMINIDKAGLVDGFIPAAPGTTRCIPISRYGGRSGNTVRSVLPEQRSDGCDLSGQPFQSRRTDREIPEDGRIKDRVPKEKKNRSPDRKERFFRRQMFTAGSAPLCRCFRRGGGCRARLPLPGSGTPHGCSKSVCRMRTAGTVRRAGHA